MGGLEISCLPRFNSGFCSQDLTISSEGLGIRLIIKYIINSSASMVCCTGVRNEFTNLFTCIMNWGVVPIVNSFNTFQLYLAIFLA